MIKSLRTGAIIFIIVSILLFLGGMVFSNLAEEHRGEAVQTGYNVDGEYVYTGVKYLNANNEAEESAESLSGGFYAFSVVFFCVGVVLAIVTIKKKATKTVYKSGIILEKIKEGRYEFVIVEFEDNTRKRLILEPTVFVAQGDKGKFGYKNKSLVEFVKE